MSPTIVQFGLIFIAICIVLDLLAHIILIGEPRPAIKGGIVAIEAVATIVCLWVLYRALELIQ